MPVDDSIADPEELDRRWPELRLQLLRRGRTWRLPEEELEDAASHTYEKVRRRLGRPPRTIRSSRLGAYVHRAYQTELAMTKRAAHFARRDPQPLGEVSGDGESALAVVARHQSWDALAECLRALPPRLQRLLAWRYWDEELLSAFGRSVGVTPPAVTKMHVKAKDLLRNCLHAKGFGPSEADR